MWSSGTSDGTDFPGLHTVASLLVKRTTRITGGKGGESALAKEK